MRTFIIKPGDLIPIGRAGENQATEIRFDVTGWAETFGAGQYALVMKRPGDSELPYPVEVTTDGDYVVWVVSNVDTGIVGNARVQLRYTVDGALAKSVIYRGIVGESLDNIVDPPDPYEDLIGQMVDLTERAEAAAESASGSAGTATTAAEAAQTAKTAAETAAGQAQSAKEAAQASATTATQAKETAQTAQTAAETAQAAAAQSATAASGSATAAAGSATQAAASATDAAEDAAAASSAKTEAQAAQAAAEAAVQDVEAAGTEQIGLVQAEGATQIAAIEAKGEEVLSEMIDKAPVIIDTASGAIASFPDGSAAPIKQLTVAVNPVQDLHGYDNPWPAGGGKNKVPYPYTSPDGTYAGVAFTTTGEKIVASGTTNNSFIFTLGTATLTAGTYRISVDGTHTGVQFRVRDGSTTIAYLNPANPSNAFVLAEDTTVTFDITRTTADISINTHFQCEVGSTATDWQPYSNICPITGWTGADVTRTGKNLFATTGTGKTESGVTWTINADGSVTVSGTATDYTSLGVGVARVSPSMGVVKISGTNIGLNASTNIYFSDVRVRDINKQTVHTIVSSGSSASSFTVDLSQFSDTYDIAVMVKRNNNVATNGTFMIQVEIGNTVTEWTPYAGTSYPITFPSESGTVYGGTLTVNQDGSAGLAAEWANIASYAGETLPGEWISDRDVYAPGTTPTIGAQVVYKLATPVTYTLTAAEMTTLFGQNNWWADTGDVSVTYRADTKLYIDKKLAALVAALS